MKTLLEQSMQKMKKGEEQAFEMVYELTKKQVFFTILAIIKDYGIAEELMQDTYIRLRKNIAKYENNTNANAWIVRIAHNLAINEYHKRKKELITDELENDFLFHSVDENSLLNNLLLKQLFNILNVEEREIVMLHTLGYKHHEISKQIEKPLGTVLWIYNKAIKKMQKEVAKDE